MELVALIYENPIYLEKIQHFPFSFFRQNKPTEKYLKRNLKSQKNKLIQIDFTTIIDSSSFSFFKF